MQLQPQVHQKYQSIATIIELHIQQFHTKEGEQNHKFLKVDFAYVNPIQDGPFRGCSRSPKSVTHTPQWWNFAWLYHTWRRSKKYINHVTHPLDSADISNFSPAISIFCYISMVISRNTDIDCILIHNSQFFSLFLSLWGLC